MTYKAIDIANKILAMPTNSESEELISNMKLQKLLYYIQGFHLAFFEAPLFEEDIEAWMYGPVVPSVYSEYKSHGNNGISFNGKIKELSKEQEKVFNEVYRVYSQYSAIGLMNLTHSETPWMSVEPGRGNIISQESMREFFKSRIE